MPAELARRVVQSRAGGRVERAHGIPHVGSYSVAMHSWGVAMLMLQLWPDDFPRLAAQCLCHDVPEAWVGDIPAPVGRYAQGVKPALQRIEALIAEDLGLPAETSLSPEDHRKLKICDHLEFWVWSREQELMGNQMASEGRREIERYFEEQPLPPYVRQLFDALRDQTMLPRQAGVIQELCSER